MEFLWSQKLLPDDDVFFSVLVVKKRASVICAIVGAAALPRFTCGGGPDEPIH